MFNFVTIYGVRVVFPQSNTIAAIHQTNENYSVVYTQGGHKFLTTEPIEVLLKHLPFRSIRLTAHRKPLGDIYLRGPVSAIQEFGLFRVINFIQGELAVCETETEILEIIRKSEMP